MKYYKWSMITALLNEVLQVVESQTCLCVVQKSMITALLNEVLQVVESQTSEQRTAFFSSISHRALVDLVKKICEGYSRTELQQQQQQQQQQHEHYLPHHVASSLWVLRTPVYMSVCLSVSRLHLVTISKITNRL